MSSVSTAPSVSPSHSISPSSHLPLPLYPPPPLPSPSSHLPFSLSSPSPPTDRFGPPCSTSVPPSPSLCLAASPSVVPPAAMVEGGGTNRHFHLHLHNYLSSNSNVVAISSRMVATDRAIESLQPPSSRLFTDPLAKHFAGEEMMAKALLRQRDLAAKERAQSMAVELKSSPSPHDAPSRIPLAVASAALSAKRLSRESDPSKAPRTAIRTKFFDDVICKAIEESPEGAASQLILLGCGMDSRPFRLTALRRIWKSAKERERQRESQRDSLKRQMEGVGNLEFFEESKMSPPTLLPSIRVSVLVFELDDESILSYKNEILRHLKASDRVPLQAARVTLAVKLHDAKSSHFEWRRTAETPEGSEVLVGMTEWAHSMASVGKAKGFNVRRPSFWLLDGNLSYFSHEEQMKCLHDISLLSSESSILAFSQINQKALDNMRESARGWGANLSQTFKCCFNDEVKEFLTQCGWDIVTFTQMGAPDCNYGRWGAEVFPIDDPHKGTALLVVAKKVRPMKVLVQLGDDGNFREFESENPSLRMISAASAVSSPPSLSVCEISHPSQRGFPEDFEGFLLSEYEILPEDSMPMATDKDFYMNSPPPSSSGKFLRESVIDCWNSHANQWTSLMESSRITKRMAESILEILPFGAQKGSPPSVSFLPLVSVDVGIGSGVLSMEFLRRFPLSRVHLIDPSQTFLNECRKKIYDEFGEFAVMSANALRGSDLRLLGEANDFVRVDLIMANGSLHLMGVDVIRCAEKILKDGGVFVFSLFGRSFSETLNEWEENIENAIRDIWRDAEKEGNSDESEDSEGTAKRRKPTDSLWPFWLFPSAAISREEILGAAESSGFSVELIEMKFLSVPLEYFIELSAMSGRWDDETVRRAKDSAKGKIVNMNYMLTKLKKKGGQ